MMLAHQRTQPSIVYAFADAPGAGKVMAVAPGILWLRIPLPFALDHINLWALEDQGGWTLVDCGLANNASRVLWSEILAGPLGAQPVRRLIVTHCHPDHIGLAQWFCRQFDLQPWMTEAEFLHAHAVFHRVAGTSFPALIAWCRANGLDEARLGAFNAGEDHYRSGVPELPHAFRRMHDGERLSIGCNAWRVIVGHGHSPEHAALYCETLGVVIAGDMLLPRITTNVSVWPAQPDGDPLGQFLGSLAAFEALPDDTLVLPSHGMPFHGAARRVAELRDHHGARLGKLSALCAAPRTAAELLPALFTRRLDEHHLVFALGETIAHLNHLMHRGVLDRTNADHARRYLLRAAPLDAKALAT